MVRFHPTNQTLVGFADGIIAPNESILVSAHCDLCEQCRSKVLTMTEITAELIFEQDKGSKTANIIDNELANMFDAIVSRPSVIPQASVCTTGKSLFIDGKSFKIPPSLQRFSESVGDWSHLVGKLWQAPVSIGGKNLANFIYMERGGSVPEHTHIGNERTLVLNGSFSDGVNEYDTGDYIALNESHTHTPIAALDEGCLVFSIIDEPLHFTSGWARLINPLSHLYFKVSTKN
ncbi:ChrR family anti-sigma-E factor [Glaciecola sp. SC05]|uniref:ChrR family anti-sigma-E factor n=1 Tax=Glaciecola sp. SC05 TaxID=1987355 RepID=UPI0035277F71